MEYESVVDSSVVLAFIRQESGGEQMQAHFSRTLMSAVNFCEVAGKLYEDGYSTDEIRMLFSDLGISIAPVDTELAIEAGALRPETRHLCLSLGDRFCLALGRRSGLPVYTADRRWAKLSGMDIRLIR